MYVEIVDVSPQSGSKGGGTTITVTMNYDLSEYIGYIVVKVGGKLNYIYSILSLTYDISTSVGELCDNVTLLQNNTAGVQNAIQCVTKPHPPSSEFYPGRLSLWC